MTNSILWAANIKWRLDRALGWMKRITQIIIIVYPTKATAATCYQATSSQANSQQLCHFDSSSTRRSFLLSLCRCAVLCVFSSETFARSQRGVLLVFRYPLTPHFTRMLPSLLTQTVTSGHSAYRKFHVFASFHWVSLRWRCTTTILQSPGCWSSV